MPAREPNYWPSTHCAEAYWSQHELASYQELLHDTIAWAEPQPGERWLDLGCGGGRLTEALWRASGGVAQVVGMDCALANETAWQRLRMSLGVNGEQLHFIVADFAAGLPMLAEQSFDGVVSGLAIQYAESFCASTGRWTTEAYDRVLAEVFRVLRPGGRFVFSVNVPDPQWSAVGWQSFTAVFTSKSPLRFLRDGFRMWRYGNWVKREAARGRFQFLPIETIVARLADVGFANIEHRLSYAGQAYVVRAFIGARDCQQQ